MSSPIEEEKTAEIKNHVLHSNIVAQSPTERELAEQSSHEDVTNEDGIQEQSNICVTLNRAKNQNWNCRKKLTQQEWQM